MTFGPSRKTAECGSSTAASGVPYLPWGQAEAALEHPAEIRCIEEAAAYRNLAGGPCAPRFQQQRLAQSSRPFQIALATESACSAKAR